MTPARCCAKKRLILHLAANDTVSEGTAPTLPGVPLVPSLTLTHTHTQAHVHTYTHTHTCIHTQAHVHTHTHTPVLTARGCFQSIWPHHKNLTHTALSLPHSQVLSPLIQSVTDRKCSQKQHFVCTRHFACHFSINDTI